MPALPEEIARVQVLRERGVEEVAKERESTVACLACDHGRESVEVGNDGAAADAEAPIADARQWCVQVAADRRQPGIGREGKLPSWRRAGLGPGTACHNAQR